MLTAVRLFAVSLALLLCACGTHAPRPSIAWEGARTSGAVRLVGLLGTRADGWRLPVAQQAALSPDDRWLVLAGDRVTLVELPSGIARTTLVEHAAVSEPGQLAFSADGRRFAAADPRRGCVAVWTLASLVEERCIAVPDVWRAFIALSPDGAAIMILAGDHTLGRWEVAGGERWDVPVGAPVWTRKLDWNGPHRFVRWPQPALIVTSGDGVTGRDPIDGSPRWHVDRIHFDADDLLGTRGHDLLVIGYGGLAAIDVATGALTVLEVTPVAFGALLPDDTSVVVEHGGVVRRSKPDGTLLSAFALPPRTRAVAPAHTDPTAVLLTEDGPVRWDLAAGRPAARPGEQHTPIIALAATRDRVVSAGRDGSLLVRDRAGGVRAERRVGATECAAWSIAPSLRRAACAASLAARRVDLAVRPSPVEWLALDGDGTGRGAGGDRDDPATDPATALAWLDDELVLAGRWWHDRARDRAAVAGIEAAPALAARLGADAVAIAGHLVQRRRYASAMIPPPREVETRHGLAVLTRAGHLSHLDRPLIVDALAASPGGETLAVAAGTHLSLWRRAATSPARRRAGIPAADWYRAWDLDDAAPRSYADPPFARATVAVSAAGRTVALAANEGLTVTIHDGVTGDLRGTLSFGGLDQRATALTFDRETLFVGTSAGQILELDVAR